jgi:hypothetical protein
MTLGTTLVKVAFEQRSFANAPTKGKGKSMNIRRKTIHLFVLN